jgi:hypothetical protein
MTLQFAGLFPICGVRRKWLLDGSSGVMEGPAGCQGLRKEIEFGCMSGGLLEGKGGFFDQLRSGAGNRQRVLNELFLLTQPGQEITIEVFTGCAEMLSKGELSTRELRPHMPRIMELWKSAYVAIKPFQHRDLAGKWSSDDNYLEQRGVAGAALDLFGHLPFEEVSQALGEGQSLLDPRLKLFASLSLLRLDQALGAREIETVAATLETRILLWRGLRALRLERVMPIKWSHPASLAESSLADWVSSPFELGQLPSEIELKESFPTNGDEGILDVYLFRFRSAESLDDRNKWRAGIAGPFCKGEELSSPWSAFDSWEAMSPEEHFQKLYFRQHC